MGTTGATISAYYNVGPAGSEDALEWAVGMNGPVSVAIDASNAWSFYDGGIFSGDCSSDPDDATHAVLVTGYDSNYWIVKNSWGTGWGEEGYIRMARGNNTCGLANSASFAKA